MKTIVHPVALRRRGELAFRTRGESEEGGWMDVAIMVKRGRERRREGDACEIGLDQRDFLNQRRERQRKREGRGTGGLLQLI